ncbi:MAG: FKBP-type peptidyl-prolyl cis-trans isomerase [Clostridia bacterium]|nr:FKBP-type peptidyl-prolyl cis-trans isomerase [Clostridia bacterium]
MRSTRIIALIMAVVMLAAALVGCGSAYDNPADYLELPADFSKITVKYADLEKEIEDQIESTLNDSVGQVFEPVTNKDATVQMGDEVYISFKGTADKELSDTVKEKLTNENFYLTIGSNNSTLPVDYTNKNDNNSDNDKDEEKVAVEGIEKQLIGKKAGDKLTLKGKFSNSYGTEDLKNVTVTYEIEIKAIARVSVSKDHKVKVTYTVTDKKNDVKVPVITTTKETTTEAPETTTTPVTTTTAPTSTKAPTTTKKATFAELFPSVTDKSKATELDFSKTTTAFASLYTLADLFPAFKDKNLYEEFALELTVPENAADKYADYKGKTVYYVFKIESTTSTPKMTDYFINKATINATNEEDRFSTAKAYREYLDKEFRKTLAYEAILEASTVTKMPKDEWEQSYENYLNQYVCDYLATKDKNNTGSGSVTLENYTPSQLEKLIPERDYEELRVKASVDAQDSVKQRLTMESLFNKFKIKLSDKEYDSKMKEEEDKYNANLVTYVYYYGIYSFDQYITYFGGEEYFELQWKYEKLLDKLPDSGVQYEKAPSEDAE